MRNDTHRWANSITHPHPKLVGSEIEIRVCETPRQTLISGNYKTAIGTARVSKAYGWPDLVSDEHHALRLRRDRILIVNGSKIRPGWLETERLAITDVSAIYGIIELKGTNAMGLLQSGTEIDVRYPSGSVMRRWHGIDCMIVAIDAQKFRLHVPRSYLSYVWDMLETQVYIMFPSV